MIENSIELSQKIFKNIQDWTELMSYQNYKWDVKNKKF